MATNSLTHTIYYCPQECIKTSKRFHSQTYSFKLMLEGTITIFSWKNSECS